MRRLTATLAGSATASVATLGLLVLVLVFAALAGPAETDSAQNQALRDDLASQSAKAGTVAVSADWSAMMSALMDNPQAASYLTQGQLASARRALAGGFTAAGLPLAPGAWTGLASRLFPVVTGAAASAQAGTAPELEVLYQAPLAQFAHVVAGSLSPASSPSGAVGVAVTTLTAARFGLRPGSRLRLTEPSGPATLAVTAILRVRDASSSFWNTDSTAVAPGLVTGPNRPSFWAGAVLADPGELRDVQAAFSNSDLTVQWQFPVNTGLLRARQVAAVHGALTRLSVAALPMGALNPASTTASVSSALTSVLGTFLDTQASVDTVLVLLFVSLIVTGAAVITIAAQMVAVRRAGELALIRARGGSLPQVAVLMFRSAAAVAVPAGTAGAGLVWALWPGDFSSALGWSLAIPVVVIALAAPPLAAVWRHRRPAPAVSPALVTAADPARGHAAPLRRWVTEAAACAAAVAGLILLHDQGLPAAGQTDLLLAAAPVLVAVPAVLVVARLYPLAVRGLLRLSARATGATGFIGVARASRSALTGVLPVFALVLGLSVAAFAGMVRDAVARGEVAASWRDIGADAVVDTGTQAGPGYVTMPVTATDQRAITAAGRARRAAVVWVTSWTGPGGQPLTVLAVDPDRYAALVASTPFPRFPAGRLALAAPGLHAGTAVLPVLASPAAAALLGSGSTRLTTQASPAALGPIRVRVAGRLSSTPAQVGHGADWLVMPVTQLPGPAGRPAPQVLLMTGPHLAEARTSAVAGRLLPLVTVTYRSAVLAGLTGAPIQHSAALILLLAVVAAALLGLCTLVIGLALGAADRAVTLARLTTMGLEQPLLLLVAEALPALLAAALAALACALALPGLAGPALSLSVFTGSAAPVPVRPSWLALGLPAAAVLITAVAALAGQTAARRRHGVTRSLRAH
jgi:putative ABC transport system permease protein